MVKKITIAIDAMGGENSPGKTINGVYLFTQKNRNINDFQINLYGEESKIKNELSKYNIEKDLIKLFIQTLWYLMKKHP